MGAGRGLEGDDFTFVSGCAALMDELAGVGACIEHEVDGDLGEEELVAEFWRGVDAGFSDLEACGFGEGAQRVFEVKGHGSQISGFNQRLGSQFSCLSSETGGG